MFYQHLAQAQYILKRGQSLCSVGRNQQYVRFVTFLTLTHQFFSILKHLTSQAASYLIHLEVEYVLKILNGTTSFFFSNKKHLRSNRLNIQKTETNCESLPFLSRLKLFNRQHFLQVQQDLFLRKTVSVISIQKVTIHK